MYVALSRMRVSLQHSPCGVYVCCYDTFHCKCNNPEIHQIEKLRFLSISRHRFILRFWLDLNLYQGIRVSRFGGFRGCGNSSGNFHMLCVILDMCSDISLCLACVCPRPLAACKHMACSCLLLCQPSFRPCVLTYPHSAGPAIFLKTNGGGGGERWGGGSMGRKCWVCAGIECRVCRFDEGILIVRVKE